MKFSKPSLSPQSPVHHIDIEPRGCAGKDVLGNFLSHVKLLVVLGSVIFSWFCWIKDLLYGLLEASPDRDTPLAFLS